MFNFFSGLMLTLTLLFTSVALHANDFNFIRSDCNQDAQVDMSDAISILSYLYLDWETPCLTACDVNDDFFVEDADFVYLTNYLFQGGPTPPDPFPACGTEQHFGLDCTDPVCP